MAVSRRLLLLTLYYPPDLAAGSFRSSALVRALRAADPALAIDVLTSMPNRYKSFAHTADSVETDGSLTVRRLPMPVHKSDMRTQALAYGRFARAVTGAIGSTPYDLIVATSSRLMTAALGSWVSRRTGVPVYLDVRDLFVDTMGDILPKGTGRLLAPALSMVEQLTMRRATHINVVSPGFEAYFRHRYPTIPLTCFTNGIDEEFIGVETDLPASGTPATGPMTVVYAGNIGEGQGLHAIVPPLAAALGTEVRFCIIGDGGRRQQLLNALDGSSVRNVDVLPPMPRERLVEQYQAADVLFLHLHAYDAFTRVLPSKIFEYGAMGKPVWAGVGGVAAEFLRREVRNAAVFSPCDVNAGLTAWESLEKRHTPRPEFIAKFRRSVVMGDMARHILSVMP
jgi:hypothetical protein